MTTVNARFRLPEMPRRWSRPLSLLTCRRVLVGLGVLVALVIAVQIERGRNHEYQRMAIENKALSLEIGTLRRDGETVTPPSAPGGMYYLGSLGAFDLFARPKAGRVAGR
ncbi:MAG: hypothetical protein WC829_02735 [Hyphomicrobium sp.]|jgi:hypothetical protein